MERAAISASHAEHAVNFFCFISDHYVYQSCGHMLLQEFIVLKLYSVQHWKSQQHVLQPYRIINQSYTLALLFAVCIHDGFSV